MLCLLIVEKGKNKNEKDVTIKIFPINYADLTELTAMVQWSFKDARTTVYSKERFFNALEKAIQRIRSEKKSSVENLLQHRERTAEILDRIVVKTGNKVHVIPVEKIHYLEAQDDYVMIYTDSERHLKQKTMKFFEAHLDPSAFIRVHRSYIVRIDQISQLEQFGKESYLVIIKNGTKLPVSKSGYKKIKMELDF